MVEANRQVQLLADAGRVLSGTLEIELQIRQLAELVVPTLGDWCWIVVTDEQGRQHGVASGHSDPNRRVELESYVRSMVATMADTSAARVVAATGQPMVMPTIDPAHVEEALPDPAVRAAFSRLDAATGAIVPLTARGQVLGALGVFSGRTRAPLTAAEIETAIEIGRRAGLALHHSRLFGQQRDLADALQRSMLTEPPHIDGCEIVVRYVPASAGAEIGGDWYDAFFDRGGHPVLAIGDVVGHDTRAAAAMGQVRGLLRGISFSSGGTPAEVLARVDRAMDGLALDTMATALVARLESGESAGTRLRWANAGHPPAMLIGADGTVEVLGCTPADLLLGVSPECVREDHVTDLDAGATLLLYTDGLVERRDRDIDAGTDELVSLLEEFAGLPLGELCDRVVERLFLPDAADDVAVLAVRLQPAD
jgi:serine phosphatase RsbU (regulator of sigma subunit)